MGTLKNVNDRRKIDSTPFEKMYLKVYLTANAYNNESAKIFIQHV